MAVIGHQGALGATGELVGNVDLNWSPEAIMAGSFNIDGDASWDITPEGDLNIVLSASADASWDITPEGDLRKYHAIVASALWDITPAGPIDITHNLGGDPSWDIVIEGTMKATYGISGTLDWDITPTGLIAFPQGIDGDIPITWTSSATMGVTRKMAASTSWDIDADGPMHPTRAMDGDVSWEIDAPSLMNVSRTIGTASATWDFTPLGFLSLVVPEALAGTVDIDYVLSGAMAKTANGLITADLDARWVVWTTSVHDGPTSVPIPTQAIIDYVHDAVTCVTRQVDIYESDGTTLYYEDAPVLDGSVTVSQAASERRTLDLTIDSCDITELQVGEGYLWYDKIIKVYRGADTGVVSFTGQIGTFVPDRIESNGLDSKIKLTARDHTKRLLGSKFGYATYFPANEPIENIISTIATNAGIINQSLPLTGESTSVDNTFDAGSDRWAACLSLANAYNYDLYFDVEGTLVMAPFADIDNDPITYEFQTGLPDGNLSMFSKRISDARIRNHIVVRGEETDQTPLVAEARNVNPASSTRIGAIGERTEVYDSAWVTDIAQAQTMADQFLSIAGLDSFEVPLEGIVVPWLDVNSVVTFIDPDPVSGDPTRFLMTDITIPLGTSPMQATIRRVVNVA